VNFEDLIVRNRSYRRFRQSPAIDAATIRRLVDIARRTPSGTNRQPLKYIVVAGPERCARLFRFLKWAVWLKWNGPAEGERPTGYVIVLCDKEIAKDPGADLGIACQSMLLAAVEKGFGGCMLGNIDRDGIREEFKIPERFDIALVVALGTPGETCVLEDAKPGGDLKYYRDAQDVHHVPKRPLDEVIVTFD
jgi:nitroreductase